MLTSPGSTDMERKDTGWKSKPITALQYWFLGILWVPAEREGETTETNRQGGGSR